MLHSLNPRTESIRNPVKDLRKGFAKIFNGFEPLTDFAESLVLDAWQVLEYNFCSMEHKNNLAEKKTGSQSNS